MMPKAITALIRWWANHPWVVFWSIFVLLPFLFHLGVALPLEDKLFNPKPQPRTSLENLLGLVSINLLMPAGIALVISFIRGMLVMWRRSKIKVALVVVIFGVPLWVMEDRLSGRDLRIHDVVVKSNIRKAAMAQEAFFLENRSYTDSVGNLMRYGYNQDPNVTIVAIATATNYEIKGSVETGCKFKTGIWHLNRATDTIDGTPCSPPDHWYSWE